MEYIINDLKNVVDFLGWNRNKFQKIKKQQEDKQWIKKIIIFN